MPTKSDHTDDDIFKESRMSFGDHIEELRTRLFLALKGLLFCLVIGFVLDYIGVSTGYDNIGVGRPVMRLMVEPVETAAKNYYYAKLRKLYEKLPTSETDPEEVERIRQKLTKYEDNLTVLSADEVTKLVSAPRDLPLLLPIGPFKELFGEPKKDVKQIVVTAQVFPATFNALSLEGEAYLGSKKHITTLSAQESLVVYFKVSILCGVVLGSPWIFYQLWAFIAAGLYPREKAYVYQYLPFAVCLFLAGVFLCQFIVLPGAVKALLSFNTWIDTDPDLRLNEWLSFAIILPLVFGVSFQTPMVMFLLNRLGIFSWQDYWSKWRYAMFILAIFAAFITPTPDAVTMLYLFVPLFGLYMFGVGLCWIYPPSHESLEEDDSEIAV